MDNQANSKEIPILAKFIQMYKIFYRYLELFPKKDKYALGAKCETTMIAVLELLLAASRAEKNNKKNLISQASIKFDALKIFMRLTWELKILDDKKYAELQTHLQEIGKMIGGWLRSLN
ncbi:MAG: diversity-generating retroelement protein Avd [Candidatus Magasanikbacteria bacterium]|nr:diversity-generating retroelement protein Avd [Candidatus Magasanikbacteria bacterium]